MSVRALIYLPHVSKACSRVREFTRCKEQGNLLCYNGRPLEVAEFNALAPKVLLQAALYGMQPIVKLVEVADTAPAVPESPPVPPVVVKTKPEATANAEVCPPVETNPAAEIGTIVVEPLNDGFMLVDLRGAEALYRGTGENWESDASLVAPFASEAEAREAGGLPAVAPAPVAEDATKTPAVEETAKAASAPAAPAAKKAKKAKAAP